MKMSNHKFTEVELQRAIEADERAREYRREYHKRPAVAERDREYRRARNLRLRAALQAAREAGLTK
jgi:hypothetical protein